MKKADVRWPAAEKALAEKTAKLEKERLAAWRKKEEEAREKADAELEKRRQDLEQSQRLALEQELSRERTALQEASAREKMLREEEWERRRSEFLSKEQVLQANVEKIQTGSRSRTRSKAPVSSRRI